MYVAWENIVISKLLSVCISGIIADTKIKMLIKQKKKD